MNLNDLASAILIKTQQFPSRELAKEAVMQTFKSDFPYWSYSEWNITVPFVAGKAILRIYESDVKPTINQLIIDLPALVASSSKIRSMKR
jgi:hypothetical protein